MNRDQAHDKLDQILNVRDRNRPGFQTDWKATRIGGHRYAHDNDIWSRLEPGDPSPRTLVDDLHLFEEEEETERREDRIEGRNRRYGTMSGGRLVGMDSAPEEFADTPATLLVEAVERKLRGRTLDTYHQSLLFGLRDHCTGKSLRQCRLQTLRGLLTNLAA